MFRNLKCKKTVLIPVYYRFYFKNIGSSGSTRHAYSTQSCDGGFKVS